MKAITDLLRWRFDIYERYEPCMKRLSKRGQSILEIGTGDYGLKYFGLKDVKETDINGKREYLDITRSPPDNLPRFDTVVAIDVLEHIAPNKRMTAIRQMYKIAKKKIFLSVPNGSTAYEFDKKLYKLFSEKGYHSKHLEEHINYRVFNVEDFIKKIKKIPRTKSVKIFNGIDIKTHKKITLFLFSKSKFLFLLKNKLLYPIRKFIISRAQTSSPYHKFIELSLK